MVPGSGTPSGILAWRISWTEDPGRLQSTRSKESFTTQRVTLSPGSQGCLSPAHPKPAAWKLVPGVWRAPSEKEGPPTKLVWGRQVRLQPLQAPSTGGSVGSWGPKGPVWLPTPSSPPITPSQRKHDRGRPWLRALFSGLGGLLQRACEPLGPWSSFPWRLDRGPERHCALSLHLRIWDFRKPSTIDH